MLLPLRVESARSRAPLVTVGLLGVNALIYLLSVITAWDLDHRFLADLIALPDSVLTVLALLPDQPALIGFGLAPWIHLDIVHLMGNLLFLWVFGLAAEEALGPGPVLGIYLLGGVASTLLQYLAAAHGWAAPQETYAGSSGAVIAVIVALAARRYRSRVQLMMVALQVSVPAGIALVAFLAWYGLGPLLWPAGGGTDGYWGHLGGVIVGVLAAISLKLVGRGRLDYRLEDAVASIARGELRSGLQELERLARIAPQDPRIPLEIARTHVRTWDLAGASAAFSRAAKIELRRKNPAAARSIVDEAAAAGITIPDQAPTP